MLQCGVVGGVAGWFAQSPVQMLFCERSRPWPDRPTRHRMPPRQLQDRAIPPDVHGLSWCRLRPTPLSHAVGEIYFVGTLSAAEGGNGRRDTKALVVFAANRAAATASLMTGFRPSPLISTPRMYWGGPRSVCKNVRKLTKCLRRRVGTWRRRRQRCLLGQVRVVLFSHVPRHHGATRWSGETSTIYLGSRCRLHVPINSRCLAASFARFRKA